MQVDFEEGEKVLATKWFNQINEKRLYYCSEKPIKGN